MSHNNNQYIKQYRAAQANIIFEGIGGTGKAYILYLLLYLKVMLTSCKVSVLNIDPAGTETIQENFYNMG
jgi:hypothetical protein